MARGTPGYGEGLASSEDDAKRFHGYLQVHYLALPKEQILTTQCWVAIALNPVTSDLTVYPSQQAAINAQRGDANRYAYMRLPPACPSVRICATLLGYFRRRYEAGWRPAGLHEGRSLILPTRMEALER